MSIFSGVLAPVSWLLLTRDSLVIANIIDSTWFPFTYRMPLCGGSLWPHERERPRPCSELQGSLRSHTVWLLVFPLKVVFHDRD